MSFSCEETNFRKRSFQRMAADQTNSATKLSTDDLVAMSATNVFMLTDAGNPSLEESSNRGYDVSKILSFSDVKSKKFFRHFFISHFFHTHFSYMQFVLSFYVSSVQSELTHKQIYDQDVKHKEDCALQILLHHHIVVFVDTGS